MAATGKTPILLYGSTTPTNAPTAGNLTNSSDGCEIAINVADKNLFFKDSTNAVNTVPIRQSSASSNGWLSSTDWSTFNGKQAALVSGTNIKTVNGASLLGSGDVGTIGVGYGGTGKTSWTANGILYASGTTTLTNGSALTYDGSTVSVGAPLWPSSVLGELQLSKSTTPIIALRYGSVPSTGNILGTLNCYSVDSTGTYDNRIGASVNFVATNTPNYFQPTAITFITNGNRDSDSSAEVMRIATGVSIGNTTDPGAANLSVSGKVSCGSFYSSGSTIVGFSSIPSGNTGFGSELAIFGNNGNCGLFYSNSGAGSGVPLSIARPSDGPGIYFFRNGSAAGYINITTGAISVNNSSDYRLKENVKELTGSLSKILQVRPVTFNWKENGSDGKSVIAHELQQLFPDVVFGEKDAVNEDGSIKPQSVALGNLIPDLIVAIKEQQSIINELTTRIKALEDK